MCPLLALRCCCCSPAWPCRGNRGPSTPLRGPQGSARTSSPRWLRSHPQTRRRAWVAWGAAPQCGVSCVQRHASTFLARVHRAFPLSMVLKWGEKGRGTPARAPDCACGRRVASASTASQRRRSPLSRRRPAPCAPDFIQSPPAFHAVTAQAPRTSRPGNLWGGTSTTVDRRDPRSALHFFPGRRPQSARYRPPVAGRDLGSGPLTPGEVGGGLHRPLSCRRCAHAQAHRGPAQASTALHPDIQTQPPAPHIPSASSM